jgi:hypothetical protein
MPRGASCRDELCDRVRATSSSLFGSSRAESRLCGSSLSLLRGDKSVVSVKLPGIGCVGSYPASINSSSRVRCLRRVMI